VVDSETRSAPIEVNLDNADGRLRSGMFAKLTIVVARRSGSCRSEGGHNRGSGPCVFVIKAPRPSSASSSSGSSTTPRPRSWRGSRPAERGDLRPLGLKDGSPVEVLAPARRGRRGRAGGPVKLADLSIKRPVFGP